jgi:hypothetical protein
MKTANEFLEELKKFVLDNYFLDEFGTSVICSTEIIIKIEQFQAEQNQVADE